MAGTMINPINISIHSNFLFIITGSVKETKKDVQAMATRQTEALEYWTAAKKKTQCRLVITPIPQNLRICFLDNEPNVLIDLIRKIKLIEVIKTLHQTITKAGRFNRSPSIAVNPNNKTARCNSKYALLSTLSVIHYNVHTFL
jgi:hypothetical protein